LWGREDEETMETTRRQLVVVATWLVICLGCVSFGPNSILSHLYYDYGPEATLDALDSAEINPENLALADLERAMALTELGRYEESLEALGAAAVRLDADPETTAVVSPRGYGPWLPEYHERVLAKTLEMANSLALYDTVGAAAAADLAVAEIAEIGCGECGFGFTRILAAFAYGGAGRFSDGLGALEGLELEGRSAALADELRRRLERGVSGSQPEGLAPPPVESERFVVAILLLGRGPYKEPATLDLTSARTIRWCRYVPRDPQTVAWAAADLEEPVLSAELTDVDEVAVAGLDLRGRRVIAGEEPPANPEKRDVRHWTSLPSSLQVLAVKLPSETDSVDLVYFSPEGDEIDRETIEVPEAWLGGPIFVVRRVP
jgi:hypothetical protein